MSYEEIAKEIERGITGKNTSVPVGFPKLNKYIAIRKKIMTLVFGSTGSGKSSFTYDAWILNTHDWWVANNRSTPIKVKPILFSFERSKIYTKTKWLTRKIYKDTGILIPIGKMLGWWQETITPDEHDLILMYEDYINDLMEYVTVVEGATNPTGCYRYIKEFAESRGRVEQISEKKKLYIPDNENEIVIPIIDHIGLVRVLLS